MRPRRGRKVPAANNIRKDIQADSQHKTRIQEFALDGTFSIQRFLLSPRLLRMYYETGNWQKAGSAESDPY